MEQTHIQYSKRTYLYIVLKFLTLYSIADLFGRDKIQVARCHGFDTRSVYVGFMLDRGH